MADAPLFRSWLAARALEAPDATALVHDGGSLTYAELLEQARRRAHALLALVPKTSGEHRVAILAGNCAEYALWVAGALEAGVQFVTLNVRLSVAELLDQVKDAQPFLLLHDAARTEAARRVADKAACRPRLLCLDRTASLLAETPCAPHLPANAYDPGRVANVMYTSGSTGRPKGVLQTLGNHAHSARNCRDNLGFSLERDVWGCPTPLFHTSGLSILMRSLACGVGVRLYNRFDASLVNDDVLAGRVTCLSAVTFQIERLLDDLESRGGHGRYPSTLRFTLQGGGPLSLQTLARCRAANMGVVQSFGMTETASQVVALSPDDAPRKAGSSGRPLGGVELCVAPQDGGERPLPAGETGRILLKTPTLAVGYLNQEERYAASFTPNGWFDTGDLGYCDEDGYLYVTCRRSDLIISGGENVYPAEVEAVLAQHPSVGGVIVAGVPDPVWGSVPAALCMPADGLAPNDPALPDASELRAFCRERLAAYKCPRHVLWASELPYTATQKPQRTKAALLLEAALI